MSAPDTLEARLRCLDLRFAATEPDRHVEDERIAVIASGAEPSEAEAAHLAACDACVDLLVAAGEGLESLASEVALTAPPPARPAGVMPVAAPAPGAGRRGGRLRLGLVIGGLALACAAAAAIGGGVFGAREAPAPATVTAERPTPAPLPAPAPAASAPPPMPAPPAPVASAGAVASPPSAVIAVEPSAPRPPARTVGRPLAGPSVPSAAIDGVPRPGAVAAAVGEVGERDAEAFGRAPVNAPGRGFGFLRLTATPPAQVFIGERAYGWTPLFDLRLPEGPHDVRLVYAHPDARTAEERFRVVIPAETRWVVKRKNLREGPAE